MMSVSVDVWTFWIISVMQVVIIDSKQIIGIDFVLLNFFYHNKNLLLKNLLKLQI